MTPSPYDAIDRAILYQLQQEGRKSITDIADEVDVTDNTVRNRIEQLEADGAIEGYQVNLNYDELGVQHYYIFSCTARVSEREQLAEEARTYHGVTEVITLMTGHENVFVIAAGSEKDAITDLATELDNLGLTIEREHLIRDHVRQPYQGFKLEENV